MFLTENDIRRSFPNVSFPKTIDKAPEGYKKVIRTDPPHHDHLTQRVDMDGFSEIGGELVQQWKIIDRFDDKEELELFLASVDLKKAKIYILAEIKVADIEIQKHQDGFTRAKCTETQWKEYRNALRNYVTDGVVCGDKPERPS